MNKKGFISISVVYAIFMLFIMLLLSVLAGLANNRILLRVTKGDTEDILVDNQDNRQVGIVCQKQQMGKCFSEYSNLDKYLFLHDGNDMESKSEFEAKDNSFRYAGSSVNVHNYLCFGTDDSPCPSEYLYRIIGIFNQQVKIIKNTPIGGYYPWNNKGLNYFRESSLYEFLNTNFINTFTPFWQRKISKVTWNIGGINYDRAINSNAYSAFDYELGDNKNPVNNQYWEKIGLMYLSDYYYAAAPTYWTKNGTNYDQAKNYNWLAAGYNEWTLTSYGNNLVNAYKIFSNGKTGGDLVTSFLQIRPVFFLYIPASLESGIGTIADPYRID